MKELNYKTLFLDRDGVINRRKVGGYVQNWEEFEYLPQVESALLRLAQYFPTLLVVTNQQGVEKGLMTEQELIRLHQTLVEDITEKGGRIDKVYYCPHHQEVGCPCRKPNTDMAFQAKRDFPDIDFSTSIMVGDSKTDLQFGRKLGMKTVLIRGKDEEIENDLFDWVFENLIDFVNHIEENFSKDSIK